MRTPIGGGGAMGNGAVEIRLRSIVEDPLGGAPTPVARSRSCVGAARGATAPAATPPPVPAALAARLVMFRISFYHRARA